MDDAFDVGDVYLGLIGYFGEDMWEMV